MKDVKIRTYGIKELSEKIQARLFELGAEWVISGKEILHIYDPYIYIRQNKIRKGTIEFVFNEESLPEITYQDLLDMQPDKKTRQEKFYQWTWLANDNCLKPTDYLYNDEGYYYYNGVLEKSITIYEAIKQGKAWKLNPDNPVILEVEL
jgi:hypothetical protein